MVMDQRHQRGDVFATVDAIRMGADKGLCLVTAQFLFVRLRNHCQSGAQPMGRRWAAFYRSVLSAAPERPEQVVNHHHSLGVGARLKPSHLTESSK